MEKIEQVIFRNESIIEKNLKKISYYLFGFALFLILVSAIIALAVTGEILWMFEGIKYGYYWFYIFATISIIIGVILLYRHKTLKTIITITNKRVILHTEYTIFKKKVDLETFIPTCTILSVVASKSNSTIVVKGTGEIINFNYVPGALEALAEVLPN